MCRTVNNFTSLKKNWKAVDQRQLLKPKWISEQPEFFRMDFPLLSKTGKLFFTRLVYSFFSLSFTETWKISIQKASITDKQACKTPPPHTSFQAAYKVLLTNVCNKEQDNPVIVQAFSTDRLHVLGKPLSIHLLTSSNKWNTTVVFTFFKTPGRVRKEKREHQLVTRS